MDNQNSQYDPRYSTDLDRQNRTDRIAASVIQGGSGASGRIAVQPPGRLNVPASLDTVDEALQALHNAISEFEGHLNLVLDPPGPSTQNASKSPAESSQIVERILRQGGQINSARIRLQQLMERLHL